MDVVCEYYKRGASCSDCVCNVNFLLKTTNIVIQLLLVSIRYIYTHTEKQGKLHVVGGLEMRLVGSSNTIYPTKS